MTADFDKDFKFSTSSDAHALVRRACHRLMPECCGVSRATPAEDRRGIDYWISTPHGRVSLDLKLRSKDYGAGRGGSVDCVLELDGHGSGGWLMKPGGATLILFACIDTSRVALFETRALQTAVLTNLARWLAAGLAKEIKTTSKRDGRTWESRAVIVSADLLVEAIDRLAGMNAANDGDGV